MPFPKETEKSMEKRAEEIKQSPKWKKIIKLSKDPQFLKTLKKYWEQFSPQRKIALQEEEKLITELSKTNIILASYLQKYSAQRKITFQEELKIKELPESRYFLKDDQITYGSIQLKFFREIENYLGSKIRCNTYFTIFCDPKANLLISQREFTDAGTIEEFEGTLNKFYDYMKKKLA